MVKRMRLLDIDVLEAARLRIRHIYDLFDSVAVCFSGGKDSLVTLHLVWEIAQERGQTQLDVIFRDEELIPDEVIAFVNEYRVKPWVKMLYFAVPLHSTKFILGQSFEYVQWDPSRRHLRPIPEHAITLPSGDDRVFDQYTMDGFTAQWFKGKVAFVTGIRAAESIMRYRASVNKLNENYITGTTARNVSLCKPIYDWQEDDVFKYLWENNLCYCALYDYQHVAGANLRVSTPLHAESAKRFGSHRAISPDFYQQVVELFPEMLEQERYWSDLDGGAIERQYGASIAGVRSYILEKILDENQQMAALRMLESVAVRHRHDPEAYPISHILKYIVGGSFKRQCLPLGKSDRKVPRIAS